jgi:hypothetical protein
MRNKYEGTASEVKLKGEAKPQRVTKPSGLKVCGEEALLEQIL